MAFSVKVYVVQAEDEEVVGAKLTREAAQALAKREAPASVILVRAEKDTFPTAPYREQFHGH